MSNIARPDFDATLASLTQTLVDYFLGMGVPADAVEMYRKVQLEKSVFFTNLKANIVMFASVFWSTPRVESFIAVGQSSTPQGPSKAIP